MKGVTVRLGRCRFALISATSAIDWRSGAALIKPTKLVMPVFVAYRRRRSGFCYHLFGKGRFSSIFSRLIAIYPPAVSSFRMRLTMLREAPTRSAIFCWLSPAR